MQTQTVNLCDRNKNVIGSAVIDVPDQRYPGDLAFIAPFLQADAAADGRHNIRYFSYVPQLYYGPPPVEEYVEVTPIVPVQASFT